MGAWSYSKIISRACSAARAPGFTAQAGDLIQSILDELCQDWDFDVAKGLYQFNFNPGLSRTSPNGQLTYGGPFPLPANYLRAADPKSWWWSNDGVPYPLIPIDLSEFDMTVQQAGVQSYPYFAASDMSQSPPVLWVYPQPSGAYPVNIRFFQQMPQVANPVTDVTVPWFPNTDYLFTRLAGELMKITGDSRAEKFLGGWDENDDNQFGAGAIMRRYLKKKDDSSNRAQIIEKDRRRFGSPSFVNLPNTKTVGW